MAAVESTPVAAAVAQVSGGQAITRLPRYFPTSCPQCAAPTNAFFQCFEQHAVMLNEHDVTTAHTSLQHCQPELRAYMACMDNNIASKSRPWWKLW